MSWEWFKRCMGFLMEMKSDNPRFNGSKKTFQKLSLDSTKKRTPSPLGLAKWRTLPALGSANERT